MALRQKGKSSGLRDKGQSREAAPRRRPRSVSATRGGTHRPCGPRKPRAVVAAWPYETPYEYPGRLLTGRGKARALRLVSP